MICLHDFEQGPGDGGNEPGRGGPTINGVCALEPTPTSGVWALENLARSPSAYMDSRKVVAGMISASDGSLACRLCSN